MVRKQEIIVRLTDYQWEILYVNNKKKKIAATHSVPELEE